MSDLKVPAYKNKLPEITLDDDNFPPLGSTPTSSNVMASTPSRKSSPALNLQSGRSSSPWNKLAIEQKSPLLSTENSSEYSLIKDQNKIISSELSLSSFESNRLSPNIDTRRSSSSKRRSLSLAELGVSLSNAYDIDSISSFEKEVVNQEHANLIKSRRGMDPEVEISSTVEKKRDDGVSEIFFCTSKVIDHANANHYQNSQSGTLHKDGGTYFTRKLTGALVHEILSQTETGSAPSSSDPKGTTNYFYQSPISNTDIVKVPTANQKSGNEPKLIACKSFIPVTPNSRDNSLGSSRVEESSQYSKAVDSKARFKSRES